MKDSLHTSLHHRELTSPRHSHRRLYGTRSLISDLDIVNELDGHSGCVNALSWSRTGNLLASGSDDQHLNIHSYQPNDSNDQFKLTATVATGHTQNIFSVKFMPGHGDRMVVTAAGDGEVRVFDLEHGGHTTEASAASSFASEGRRRGRNRIYTGVRYMSDGDTDARVYRSHGDRVKRIVTESSPNLFLTCSEDGEVRQWDLRQPSSAYPAPRSRLHGDRGVPPPLISYKRYGLDLNTISCSPSQPHYIALGGAHLHCFLHDRRMTGRDRLRETGKPLSSSKEEGELMSQATQCVRKFAPTGQQRMKRTESGHITACKISDARPDEMVVSWSGDQIYSFDLIRSPGVGEETAHTMVDLVASERRRAKTSPDRKRKRKTNAEQDDQAASALRVRYRNGQTEDIPITTRPQPLTEKQKTASRIAKATTSIRQSLLTTSPSVTDFTSALGLAASIMDELDDRIREWGYPLEPSASQVQIQQQLRRDRESTRRFVQAAGTISRALGGKLQTLSHNQESPLLSNFLSIEARSSELQPLREEILAFDFTKAILLFLESGVGRLIEGFTRPAEMPPDVKGAQRLPIPESEATTEAIDDCLIPYLLRSASEDAAVLDPTKNQFELEENRRLLLSEKQAVREFQKVVRVPFADLSSIAATYEHAGDAQDRSTTRDFWLGKVARSLLLRISERLDETCVNRAFGGISIEGSQQQDAELEEEGADDDAVLDDAELLNEDGDAVDGAIPDDLAAAMAEAREEDEETMELNEEDIEDIIMDGDEAASNSASDSEDSESSEPDEEDGVPNPRRHGFPRFMYTSAFSRRRHKEKVQPHTPCNPSTRKYSGHNNTRTVKDVNFFGPEDQYVVSGSDDGNFFIWDRKTAELVYVGEGDGEVVNVVQGHPYETMMAVSGIDHTIKIFSADSRARAKARLGDGVTASDASQFSSLAFPHRMSGRRRSTRPSNGNEASTVTSEPARASSAATDAMISDSEEGEAYVAPTGLASRKRMHDAYRIMNANDVERRGGGNQDNYITIPQAQLLQMLFGIQGG
ncbi:hypothetical protein LTR86_007750 [Recurvomyces mirabilis]|nr:hypothetical protein LTR86_007750 [Recurvomyces mirabilis]